MPNVTPADLMRALLQEKAREHAAAIAHYTDQRIRAALIEEGVDPDAVERVARRARAGEFDPPFPQVVIREDG